MTLNPYDQETLEILQGHYRETGEVLEKKDFDRLLRTGDASVQKRGRKKEYWQTLEWWKSLDDSQRQKIHAALNAHYAKTGRRRPRKSEMEELIEEALDSLKRG